MDIETNRAVGNALKTMRQEAGLTQVELAARLAKPQSYVSKIESGERFLRLCELDDYAVALDSTPGIVADRVFQR